MNRDTHAGARMNDVLDDLLAFTGPLTESIRSSGRSHAPEVETRLLVSARHVASAAFGAQLEGRASSEQLMALFPGITHATLVTAAQSLAFGNAMAALDLNASAAACWCDQTKPNGEEYDLGALISRKATPYQACRPGWVPTWLYKWADTLAKDPRLARTWDLRDGQTHRVVPRSAVVNLGKGSHASLVTEFARDVDGVLPWPPSEPAAADEYKAAVDLAEEHWRSFWSTLASNA